jgi:hypothetical protein
MLCGSIRRLVQSLRDMCDQAGSSHLMGGLMMTIDGCLVQGIRQPKVAYAPASPKMGHTGFHTLYCGLNFWTTTNQ